MISGIPTRSTALPFTRGRMTYAATLMVLTGALLLTQTAQAFNNETKYETVVDLIASLSQSSVAKEVLESVPCDTVNPTVVSYIDCKGLADGAYQDPKTTNCSEYFRCENRQRVNCSCGPDLVFDAKLQTCNHGDQKAPCSHLSDFGACFNRKDGFYPLPETSCRKYHECRDGLSTEFECKPGEAFDQERLTCMDDGQAKCSDEPPQSDAPAGVMPVSGECQGRPNGKYGVDGTGGKKFIVCSGGLKMSGGSCLEGQVFLEIFQKCSSAVAGDVCEGTEDGYYPDVSRNCTYFFNCKAGQLLSTMSCPKGMKFDRDVGYCSAAKEMFCGTVPQPVESGQASIECLGKANGYHPLPSTRCTRFVFCKNERKMMSLHCPVGQAYDASFSRCMNVNFVHCEGHPSAEVSDPKDIDCFNKSDDYYPDYASNCKKFYHCKDERKMSTLVCHPRDAFDPVTKNCHPETTVDCHGTGQLKTQCTGKKDGYHANRNTGCKTYFQCQGGHVLAELVCGTGQIFQETVNLTCVSDKVYTCFPPPFDDEFSIPKPAGSTPQRALEQACRNRTDGYYPDYASGCRRYLHCRKGHVAAEYVCTSGQLFDPLTSKCVTEHCVSCSATGLRTDIDNCDFKDDGYYPTICNGCRSYYYCRNRLNMVNITCAAGQIFDTNNKVCTDEKFAACNAVSPNSSAECRGRADGFYAATSTGNCSIYFFCSQGRSSEQYSCSNGTCFDEDSGKCLARPARRFNCSAVPSGFYLDITSACRQYFVCQGGQLEVMKCPGNMIFHLTDASCKSKRTSQCKTDRDYDCSGRPDGLHADHLGHAHLFHVCRGGQHVESGSCPLYSDFSKRSKTCVPAATRPPPVSSRPSWTSGGRPPPSRNLFDCRKLDNGFYPDVGSGCSRYYVCVDGQMVKSSQCPPGQLFDGSKQGCLTSSEVACDDRFRQARPRNSTAPSSFHFQFHDGCRNVTLCFDSRASFWLHCPVPAKAPKNPQAKHYCKVGNIAEAQPGPFSAESPRSAAPAFDCSGKEDGYYTDPDSGCRKWHMCEASRGHTYECEAGKAFNILHKRCDRSDTVTCAAQSWVYRNYSSARSLPASFRSQTQEFRRQTSPASTSQECARKSDGIYIDLTGISAVPSSTCFSVYLCINEQLYSISCPFESKAGGDHEVMCKVKDDVKCMKDTGSSEKGVAALPPAPEVEEPMLSDDAGVDEIVPADGIFTCNGRDDGFYIDLKTNCKTFYVCHGGVTITYECPASLVFNSDTKSCDLPEHVVCSLQAVNALTCPGNLTKLYPDHDRGCNSYFGCIDGAFGYVPCPAGELFDAKSLACCTAEKVACTNTITVLEQDMVEAQPSSLVGHRLPLDSSSAPSVTPPMTTSFSCSGKADGFYPDHEQDCHVFYRCVHGKKFSHYCTSGQLFSSLLQSCDFQENVKCAEQKFVSIKPVG